MSDTGNTSSKLGHYPKKKTYRDYMTKEETAQFKEWDLQLKLNREIAKQIAAKKAAIQMRAYRRMNLHK